MQQKKKKNLRGSKNLRGGVKIKFIQKGISQFPDKNRRVLSKESLQNDPSPVLSFSIIGQKVPLCNMPFSCIACCYLWGKSGEGAY